MVLVFLNAAINICNGPIGLFLLTNVGQLAYSWFVAPTLPTQQPTTEGRQTSFRFPDDVYEALRERAFRTRVSQNQIVTELLRDHFGLADTSAAKAA